jgi:hypothetical protein
VQKEHRVATGENTGLTLHAARGDTCAMSHALIALLARWWRHLLKEWAQVA